MIDENLPTFYYRPSADSVKHDATIYLSQYGGDAAPAYTLRHPDPAAHDSKNRYAAALYDSYNPEILFGEVLLIPEWTQPTPSQEEIRRNGGVPPPPQPILPHEFAIQLYNPDQQVIIKQHPASWNSASYWDFDMPMQTFRQPSTSALDRTQSDPTASEITPKINFKWKKDGKLSKDLICNLSSKSTNADGSKRKHREPDIPIAYFRHLRQVTVYEPNLSRVEMEDPKGLEVVLLLSAAVIRDVYFGSMKEVFNITEAPKNSATGRRTSSPIGVLAAAQNRVPSSQQLPSQKPLRYLSPDSPPLPGNRPPLRVETSEPRPPPTDPRSQWEIDAETARLKKQVEHEEKERKRAERAETKRVKAMLEAEQKEARRKQAEIDKETDRLRREYAAEQRRMEQQEQRPNLPPRQNLPPRHSAPIYQQPYQQPPPQQQYQQYQQYQQPYVQAPGTGGQYLQPYGLPGNPTTSGSSNISQSALRPSRSNFFGLRSHSDDNGQKLAKKQSSVF
ncbi:hypothetical protein MMC26_001169 [Xylographa opegraphella]|nr:hypothetical protein [Xylographa opegraphella]